MAPNCRMVDSLLQSPLKVRYALRTTPESHLLAEIIPSFPADTTLATWYSYLERYSITNTEAIDFWSNGDYHSRRFMAKR